MAGHDRITIPTRDFLLIPLLIVATILVMLTAAEVVSRSVFVESGGETCGVQGPMGISAMRPNCVSHRKAAEGPPVENAYNDCGYRTPASCGPPPSNTLRVALMGTSTAEGYKVPYEQTFAARLTETLSASCGRPVEFQNMGIAGLTPLDNYHRMGEALALKPDLVLIVFTVWELKARLDPAKIAARDEPVPVAAPAITPAAAPPGDYRSLIARLSDLAAESRALVVAQHYLFEDRSTFVRLYMLHGDDAGYLRVPLGSTWEERLADFDTLLEGMARLSHAHGVPMVVALAPARIQAALLSDDVRTDGVDPFAIGRRLAAIAARHGVLFVDTLADFAATPAPERLFYPVDGHMDGAGSAVFAEALRRYLTSGKVMPFATCRREQQPESTVAPR